MEKGSAELKEFNKELVRLAEPVAVEARAKGSRYRGIGPFKARRKGAGASVEQTKRRVTGLHPQFGALQMTTILIPALESQRDGIERETKEWVDRSVK